MTKIHDKYIIELAEVIKGYGNNPDDEDPFRLSEFYRFYELPNIAVSRENFEKMRPYPAGKWILDPKSGRIRCSNCLSFALKTDDGQENKSDYCPVCGAMMGGDQDATISQTKMQR